MKAASWKSAGRLATGITADHYPCGGSLLISSLRGLSAAGDSSADAAACTCHQAAITTSQFTIPGAWKSPMDTFAAEAILAGARRPAATLYPGGGGTTNQRHTGSRPTSRTGHTLSCRAGDDFQEDWDRKLSRGRINLDWSTVQSTLAFASIAGAEARFKELLAAQRLRKKSGPSGAACRNEQGAHRAPQRLIS